MSNYPLTCTISLPGLVRRLTTKYKETTKVQEELKKYGIFLLQEGTLYRCEDIKSPFCGDTTRRLI